jgi:protein-tyrosine phosphatase
MTKVVFVCEGNICRSPTAEALFTELLRVRHQDSFFDVFSRALIVDTQGQPIDPRAVRLLQDHQIPFNPDKKAKPLTKNEYDESQYVITMDTYNRVLLSRRLILKDKSKIHRLLDFTAKPGDILDPYFTHDFATAYAQIAQGCQALLERLCPAASPLA